MAKKCHCEEGIAEWIMSYADMITILMAFFVVMYSMAGDRNKSPKAEAVMGSLRQWLGPAREHWPASWGIDRKRFTTPLDIPAPADRHRAATQNAKATVPQPNATYPDGVTFYLPAIALAPPTEILDRQAIEHLSRLNETVAGKMNLIEIRGQLKRHYARKIDPGQNAADLVYQKCRAVMQFLIEQGVNPDRIQLRIIRPEESGDEAGLAAQNLDIQIDVFMLNEVLESQPGVKSVKTGILEKR